MGSETHNLRVLVADDDRRCRDSLEALLECEGFEILTAGGGREALEFLREQRAASSRRTVRIHFLVLDYNMPDLTGLDVIRVIRRELQLAIPSILVSGEASPALEESVRTEGGYALAEKPIEPVTFRQLIHKMIESQFPGFRSGS